MKLTVEATIPLSSRAIPALENALRGLEGKKGVKEVQAELEKAKRYIRDGIPAEIVFSINRDADVETYGFTIRELL